MQDLKNGLLLLRQRPRRLPLLRGLRHAGDPLRTELPRLRFERFGELSQAVRTERRQNGRDRYWRIPELGSLLAYCTYDSAGLDREQAG